jgi:hypothetical protein
MKMAITTAPYNGANNLLVSNTWLNKVLMYCSAYKLTGPARDLTCINAISGALSGDVRIWYNTMGDLPNQPKSFKDWILALHARFITRRAALTALSEFNSFEYSPEQGIQAYYHQLVLLNQMLSNLHNEATLLSRLL